VTDIGNLVGNRGWSERLLSSAEFSAAEIDSRGKCGEAFRFQLKWVEIRQRFAISASRGEKYHAFPRIFYREFNSAAINSLFKDVG